VSLWENVQTTEAAVCLDFGLKMRKHGRAPKRLGALAGAAAWAMTLKELAQEPGMNNYRGSAQ
jgi:hypothetical protein